MPEKKSYTISVTGSGKITVHDDFAEREYPSLDQALDSIRNKILTYFRNEYLATLRAATKVGVEFPDEQDEAQP